MVSQSIKSNYYYQNQTNNVIKSLYIRASSINMYSLSIRKQPRNVIYKIHWICKWLFSCLSVIYLKYEIP